MGGLPETLVFSFEQFTRLNWGVEEEELEEEPVGFLPSAIIKLSTTFRSPSLAKMRAL